MSVEKLLTTDGSSTSVIETNFVPKKTKETGSWCCFCPKKKSVDRKSHCEVKKWGWSQTQPTLANLGKEDCSTSLRGRIFEIGNEQDNQSIARRLRMSRELTMESFPEWQWEFSGEMLGIAKMLEVPWILGVIDYFDTHPAPEKSEVEARLKSRLVKEENSSAFQFQRMQTGRSIKRGVEKVEKKSDGGDSSEEDDLGVASKIRVNLKSIKPINSIKAPINMGSMSFGDYLQIPGQMAGDKSSMGSGTKRCQEDSNKSHRSSSIDASGQIQSTSTPLVTNAENDSQADSENTTNSIESSIGDFGDRKPVEWNLDDFPATAIQEFAVGTPSVKFMGLTKQHTYVQPVR